ncbi:MAG TPA: glycosyltransferase family 4 protein [Afipia sp.]
MKFVLAVFQISKRGGKERDCLAVAEHLAARGHDVTVVTTSPNADVPHPLHAVTLARSGISNHARARNFANAVAGYAAAERPDALIAFERIPGADFYFAADAAIAPRLSGFGSLLPRRRTYLALERGVAGRRAATRIFFLTQRQRDEYAALYRLEPSRGILLPLILHDERYDAIAAPADRSRIRAQLGLPEHAIIGVSIAVQPRQKGVDRSLAAAAAHPGLHLAIAGSSEDWMKQQARTLNIADRVHILPYVQNVMDLMRAGDFLIHPARAEAAGQVIGEALLAGTPAIVSGICGYGEAITSSGAGIVLPEPFTQPALVDAISAMLEQLPEMRQAAAAESIKQWPLRGRWLSVIADEVEAHAAKRKQI